MTIIYDSRQPLTWDYSCAALNSQIGICITEGYFNAGVQARVVDIESEYVSLNTSSTGSIAPEIDWQPEAVAQTEFVIQQLDNAIAELQRHRERLLLEQARLEKQGKSSFIPQSGKDLDHA